MVDVKFIKENAAMKQNTLGLNIKKLNLKNFATFDDQSVSFTTGFNAIVGETGSGKSLILDALQLILGHRADRKLIRKDCEFAIVEASFTCIDSDIKLYFDEIGYPFEDDEIIIKRVLYRTGKTKSFFNYQSCSLNNLVQFSQRYIDLVGQFENQKLLSEDYQILLIDNFANNYGLLREYRNTYQKLSVAVNELKEATQNNHERSQKIDYLEFQIAELDKLNPSIERENTLIAQKRHFQNFEENKKDVAFLNNIFEGSYESNGIITQLGAVSNVLSKGLLDANSLNAFKNAQEILHDINYKVNKTVDGEYDEQELENTLTELDSYQKLKRKFSVETEGLITLYQEFKKQLEDLKNIEDTISSLNANIQSLKKQSLDIANHIHDKRCKYSKLLATKLTTEVQQLNMVGATIKIDLTKKDELSANGITDIKFLAETNPGEGFYKVKDIASGGELSRILLSLRKVLSAKDSISIFLFDEIDTGIGGETALKVGNVLESVSLESQVIAITHLPQIAKYSEKLIIVSKDVIKNNAKTRTVSTIREISGDSLKNEVQQMSNLV